MRTALGAFVLSRGIVWVVAILAARNAPPAESPHGPVRELAAGPLTSTPKAAR